MGIFDVFKTKVNEAAGKAGEVAGHAKDRVTEMMDKKKAAAPHDPGAQAPTSTVPGAEAATEDRASNMVYEGGPVASVGEAAPGVGDDGSAPPPDAPGAGGMTQSIKDNVAQGADHEDSIDSGVPQGKDTQG
jgi:hypothetical protein